MLGWILFGLATVAVGVVIISGMVTKRRIQEKLKERGIESALITEVNKCTNTVKLEDIGTDRTLEIRGDSLDIDIDEYDMVYV